MCFLKFWGVPLYLIFLFLYAISVPAVFVAEGYIKPGQLQSATRVQIAHICETWWACLRRHIASAVCFGRRSWKRWQMMSNICR